MSGSSGSFPSRSSRTVVVAAAFVAVALCTWGPTTGQAAQGDQGPKASDARVREMTPHTPKLSSARPFIPARSMTPATRRVCP
jgi:hypothetical protein